MELLTGETLAARLRKGPLSLDETLRFGIQIADALAAAHASGIMHRDLKPANVMLTGSGVKLLDFGLAKAFAPVNGITSALESEPELTTAGVVLGTVPYMAPEQIEGKPLDQRTDIFALGALLYEMATGRPAFSGQNQATLLASVLTSDPPSIVSLRPGSPASLDRLVRTCLAKDPAARWQAARDVELQLRAIAEEETQTVAPVAGRPAFHAKLAWTIAALAVSLAVYTYARPASRNDPPATSVRFLIAPPDGSAFAYFYETDFLSLSPDGQQVAFIAQDSTGTTQVWLRPLSAVEARPLAGTEAAESAFWSPDGRSIAFFTATRLARLDLPDGAPVAVLSRDSARGEMQVQWPVYLPDGEHFSYVARPESGPDQLMEASPDRPPLAIMPVESLVQYSEPGFIAFVRDGTLLGQAFDWREGRVSGEPFAVADGIRYFLSTGAAAFATSASGALVFQSGRDLQRLAWIDRSGRDLGTVGSLASYLTFAISPDNQRLLIDRERPETGTWDVWMTDLERGAESPVTSVRLTEAFGRWLPDQQSVIYSIAAGTPPNLMRRDLALGAETPLLPPGTFQTAQDVSPDGRTLLFSQRSGGSTFDLWTLPLVSESAPAPFVQSPAEEGQAAFSPDGRFVALISNETDRPELYVTPFPGPGEKIRISTDGARVFGWARNSRELFYLTFDRRVIAVPVQTDPTLRLGEPSTLFTLDAGVDWRNFDVTSDGARFLALIPVVDADKRPITVITDWTLNHR